MWDKGLLTEIRRQIAKFIKKYGNKSCIAKYSYKGYVKKG